MPASKPVARPPNRKQFRAIPGALSLYRPGDRITFEINGVEFTATVESIETEKDKTVLYVTVSIGVFSSHVTRIDRQ